jgi:hypothetical protein
VVGSWSGQGEPPVTRLADTSVRTALALPIEWECPGRSGLCGLPLARGEALCPSCADTLRTDARGSVGLRRRIQPPPTPECARCRRPVTHPGETCRWCCGRAPVTASPTLQARIEARAVPECRGDAGMCGAPLQPGETRCGRCEQSPAPASGAVRGRCRGGNGTCGRLVLPGRGQRLACRQAAGVSRIATFSMVGAPIADPVRPVPLRRHVEG